MDFDKRIAEHERRFALHEKRMDRLDRQIQATEKLVRAGMKLVLADRKENKEYWKRQKELNEETRRELDKLIRALRGGSSNGHSS